MAFVSDRSHLSIGEVLSLLQEDFPDVTISKIRFLESQGLLDPERTPSGYRKFYESDIERLRWILRQQRENFLPLKVIKDRLASGEVDFNEDLTDPGDDAVGDAGPAADDVAEPGGGTSDEATDEGERRGDPRADRRATSPAAAAPTAVSGSGPSSTAAEMAAPAPPAPAPAPPAPAPPAPAPPASARTPSAPASAPAAGPAATSSGAAAGPVDAAPGPSAREAAALLQEAPTPRARPDAVVTEATAPAPEPAIPAAPDLFDVGATSISLTLDELIGATGLTAREVGDLERFGMLASRSLGSTAYYDEDAVLVARLAAKFAGHGVEARHLRMYKVAAEREAGVFEQLVMPMMRKRSPQARRETAELISELSALGDGLRTAMLRQLLRDYLDGK